MSKRRNKQNIHQEQAKSLPSFLALEAQRMSAVEGSIKTLRQHTESQLSALNENLRTATEQNDRHHAENNAEGLRKYKLDSKVAIGALISSAVTIGLFIVGGLQLRISRDTEKKQLRAYVAFTHAEMVCPRCDHPETLTPADVYPLTPNEPPRGELPGGILYLRFENNG